MMIVLFGILGAIIAGMVAAQMMGRMGWTFGSGHGRLGLHTLLAEALFTVFTAMFFVVGGIVCGAAAASSWQIGLLAALLIAPATVVVLLAMHLIRAIGRSCRGSS